MMELFEYRYLIDELALMFKRQYLLNDVFAGISVALVAIPLSLAVAMASSVPPEAGLISAIIGGIVAVIFGGTRLCVTGPAIAMSVLVAECVQSNGVAGLIVIGITCGCLQIVFGVFRLGHFVKLIPLPVISAFIAAIGFFIFIDQLPSAFGSTAPDQQHIFALITHFNQYINAINPQTLILALLTILLLVITTKIFPKTPAILFAIIMPTVVVHIFHFKNIRFVGTFSHSLILAPKIPDFNKITLTPLFIDGILVFILGSLETLLSAAKIDNLMAKPMLHANQELIGQGLANIASTLCGGIPVTEVVARSSVNLNSGAKTRRSALIHSLVIFAIVYLCPQLIEVIPIPVLAGILIMAAITMMDLRQLIRFWQNDKLEAFIYIITFILIISTNLINGIEIGVILSFVIVSTRLLATKISIKLGSDKNVVRISLSGNMTFWSFDKLNDLQNQILAEAQLQFVIFEFDNLGGIDSTGAKHLIDIADIINNNGIKVIFHGLTNKQQKLFSAQLSYIPSAAPYVVTVIENDIKVILENAGIKHSANDLLKHGMEKFQSNYAANYQEVLDALAKQQNPHTLLITCADSRLNPNAFFSVGLGEIFIVRNVGNVIPLYAKDNKYSEGAAIEFALDVLNIRNIVICAHTECGAVKASINNLNSTTNSGLDNWLQIIKDGFIKRKPHDMLEGVEFNLLNQVDNLKTYPSVQRLLLDKTLTISAWVYDIHSAHMLEWNGESFTQIKTH